MTDNAKIAAIDECVQALDPLARGRGNFGQSSQRPNPDIGRILRYLADRYGIRMEAR